ncbi:hypothetical protein BGZ99_004310 [Dissophora globulifera]|uniref:Arrestin-like N-terminal domain-containing protein n=1 Tax=Dissophora globulifera TaxID=979702 RepID=A0A9P6UUY5_9FUNG|nr:hypothetical protein BGZ99_004310 [Dissophora globulifera]
MTATMTIVLDGDYLVLPHVSTAADLVSRSNSSEDDRTPANSASVIPSSPSMAMASPERTLSIGAASIGSTNPSTSTSVRSSFEAEQGPSATAASDSNTAAPAAVIGATMLTGKLILSLSKPIRVASLAVSLNGSTHIAFLGAGKRAHYSRHHIRSQQFLIQPNPHSDAYTLLSEDSVEFPFAIEVPNNLPVSVTTPQGGTVYRLTAVLTLAKSNGLISFLSAGTTMTTSSTIQVYRAARPDFLPDATALVAGEEEDEEEVEERGLEGQGETSAMQPSQQRVSVEEPDLSTVKHSWPGQLETAVTIPFTQMPPQAKPDLHLRVRVLRENLTIKSFQAALWERVVFRVQKAGKPLNSKKYTIGVRERVVSAQRCDAGWINDAITTQVPHTFEKVVLFSIPTALRSHNELCTSRSCNASTFTSLARLNRVNKKMLKEDSGIKDADFGEVHIEVQHFIRYSIFVVGSMDAKGKVSTSPVERAVGDVPIIVHRFPTGPECDRTGLPSYLYSFSTTRVSYEDAHDYELEATAGSVDLAGEGIYDGAGPLGPIYGDYENDDAFMALLGYRGIRTPPSYEDSVGRPSLEASLSELQIGDVHSGIIAGLAR